MRILILTLILTTTTTHASPRKEYVEKMDQKVEHWNSVGKMIRNGDKSFCEIKRRTSMATCLRAYLQNRKIEFAVEFILLYQTAVKASLLDAENKKMDAATILLYTIETVLDAKQNIPYENPFCIRDYRICQIESGVLKQAVAEMKEHIKSSLTKVKIQRQSLTLAASTDEWQKSKIRKISSTFEKVLEIP